MKHHFVLTAIAGLSVLALSSRTAFGHCDTMDGPVVKDARVALDSKDVSPVLKWIAPDEEGEIRGAFQRALVVRALGPEARELADRFFFETLVRIHREGEGEPYTGLKPAGVEIEPAIAASDKALETGSVDVLVKMVAGEAERGIRERFARAAEARKRMGESIERGRDYVVAYVQFMHYAERLHSDAVSDVSHAEHEAAPMPAAHHD